MSGLIIAGSIAAAGALGGAALGAHAAGSASKAQANAADTAAQLQYKASQNALDFTKQQYGTSQQEMMPWLQSGQAGLANLNYLLGINPGGIQAYSPTQGATAGTYNPTVPTGTPAGGTGLVGAGARPQPVGPGMRPQPMGVSGGMAGIPSSSGITGAAGMTPTSNAVQAFGGGMQQFNPATGTAGPVQAPPAGNLGSMVNPSLGGFGSLMQPFGELNEQNDPGYQARLKLGTDALQRSAAARGNVLTGGTAKALDTYAQDYASNEYINAYNRYNQNQQNQFNRLASLAGVGQTSAQQLGNLGQNAAGQVASNLLGTAQNMGNAYQNAAAANASGIYNQAQAWNQGISGGLGALSQYQQLKALQQKPYMNAGIGVNDPYAGANYDPYANYM